MDTKDKIKLLTNWVEQYQKLNESWLTLEKVIGANLESSFGDTIFRMFDSYTSSLAAQISATVDDLAWFIYENDCGNKQLAAKNPNWKKPRKIKNIKDLVMMIEDI